MNLLCSGQSKMEFQGILIIRCKKNPPEAAAAAAPGWSPYQIPFFQRAACNTRPNNTVKSAPLQQNPNAVVLTAAVFQRGLPQMQLCFSGSASWSQSCGESEKWNMPKEHAGWTAHSQLYARHSLLPFRQGPLFLATLQCQMINALVCGWHEILICLVCIERYLSTSKPVDLFLHCKKPL